MTKVLDVHRGVALKQARASFPGVHAHGAVEVRQTARWPTVRSNVPFRAVAHCESLGRLAGEQDEARIIAVPSRLHDGTDEQIIRTITIDVSHVHHTRAELRLARLARERANA